jgi:pseudaminic acid cytidylyltransferase
MIRRIAIIPARGGSKRIPNKNIRDFCGKPMIAHILQAARESELFDVIHVSTESIHIREVVEDLGFSVDFMRPDKLADDHTPIMPVLRYVTETYASRGQVFDQVWLLMACAPLVRHSDLRQASELFDQSGGGSPVLAISEYPVPIEWAFSRTSDGKLTPVKPGMFAVRSQDLEKKYFDAGVFTVFPTQKVQASEGPGSDNGFIGHVIPKGAAIDIDEESDWTLAEAMYQTRKRS